MTLDTTNDYDDVQITTDLPMDWDSTRVATIASQTMGVARDLQRALDAGSPPEDLIMQFSEFAPDALQRYVSVHRDGDDGLELRVSPVDHLEDSEVRTDGGQDDVDEDPLERVVVGTTDDGDIDIEVATLDAEEFRTRLEAIADAAETIDTLASDAATLQRSGLRESDVVDLIYGRNASLTKGDITAALGALDDIASGSKQSDLLRRLVSDLSTLTLSETDEVLDELQRLHERYPADDPDVVTDGGRSRCSECGALLPEEIDPGTGVYCNQCGHGQHATDGGRSLDERRVDALEGIEAQLRYQNAAICELIATVERIGLSSIGVIEPPSDTRSDKSLQTWIADHDFTRQEKAEDTGIGGFGGDFR